MSTLECKLLGRSSFSHDIVSNGVATVQPWQQPLLSFQRIENRALHLRSSEMSFLVLTDFRTDGQLRV
eukprot:5922082-Amphidinium_carterae.1